MFASLDPVKTRYDISLDSVSPLIADSQPGDDVWRNSNTGAYKVGFSDSGSGVLKFQVRATTGPAGSGFELSNWTDAAANIDAPSYEADWQIPVSVWNSLLEGSSNYISVKVYDIAGNTAEKADVFYVRKDTTPVRIQDNASGEDFWRTADGGAVYGVFFADDASGLDNIQYSASTNPASADGAVLGWTDIAQASGQQVYGSSWPVNFIKLVNGATNYISVRALDRAGNFSTLNNAFKILKNAYGPLVQISSPSSAYHSALPVIAGMSIPSTGDIIGNEVSMRDSAAGLYWDGAGFVSVSPVWFSAEGAAEWRYDSSSVSWVNGKSYSVVVRSSDTAGNYSAMYSTSSFIFDSEAPSGAITAPAGGAFINTPNLISGTASDSAPDSGIARIEISVKRVSDGKWWDFFSGAWGNAAVWINAGNSASWSYALSAGFKSAFASGESYYAALRVSDNAVPANMSEFGLYSSTFSVLDTIAPSAVTDFTASSAALPGSALLSWTAPGDDGNAVDISSGEYRIQYSTYAEVEFSTMSAQLIIATSSVKAGGADSYLIAGLSPGVTYYFRIWARDEVMNWSEASNTAFSRSGPALPSAISGHVTKSDGEGITAVLVEAYDSNGSLKAGAYTLADGSGTYLLEGLPAGVYKVQASWSVNEIMSSVSKDGIEMGSAGVDFALEINYTLASISGQIPGLGAKRLAARAAVRSAPVSSLSGVKDPASEGDAFVEVYQRGKRIALIYPGPNGRFMVSNLLPGRYSLRAYNGLEYTEMMEVTLAEGETVKLKFAWDVLPQNKVYAFPNPAKDSAVIRFESYLNPPKAKVMIFDIAGNLVRQIDIAEMSAQPGNVWHALWDIKNSRGEKAASGVYLFMVMVRDEEASQAKKVIKKLAVIR